MPIESPVKPSPKQLDMLQPKRGGENEALPLSPSGSAPNYTQRKLKSKKKIQIWQAKAF